MITKKTKSLLKLAYISTLPSQRSGISNYSVVLLKYLSQYYDIDLIVEDIDAIDKSIKETYIIKDVNLFKATYQLYDRILYHFGNSAFHTYMIRLLKETKGIVVLHDFFLSGLAKRSKLLTKKNIYNTHGYTGLSVVSKSQEDFLLEYPLNQEILENSYITIVHSEYSKQLLKQYYNTTDTNLLTIPLLRQTKIPKLNKVNDIDIPSDSFVVASFGILHKNKENQKLLNAWLESSLSKNKKCYLIFVGQKDNSEYIKKLEQKIKNDNIRITNYIDDNTYTSYLNMTNIAVQLRSNSRGESSAAVLDTMNHSIATIINANGSMKEFPNDCVCMLKDDFKTEDLTTALETLYQDTDKRENMAKHAREYICKYHNPIQSTKKYYEFIEYGYTRKNYYEKQQITHLLSKIKQNDIFVNTLAKLDTRKYTQKQILVDISAIIKHDLNTGIQRVVKEQIKELIKNSPKNIRIEPIYLKTTDDGISDFYYAREYTLNLLTIDYKKSIPPFEDELVLVKKDDILYSADLAMNEVQNATDNNIYQLYKNIGVKIVFLIHDILPLTNPSFFPPTIYASFKNWLENVVAISDTLITTTLTGKEILINYFNKYNIRVPVVETIMLGSDIPHKKKFTIQRNNDEYKFLIVGTVEPRKAHYELIKAFDMIWKKDNESKIILTIVGKKGWMVEETLILIETHPLLNKNLFYEEYVSDDYLSYLYQSSDTIIVASYAEGFGLPLIEAAYNKKSIIVRDIPVFREIGKNYPIYFKDSKEPLDIVCSIEKSIKEDKKKKELHILTWEENAKRLLTLFSK